MLPVFSMAQEEAKTVLVYQPYKFLDNEEDYMVYEDNLNDKIATSIFCENTGKLYLLEGRNNIVEYDLTSLKKKSVDKRRFSLAFDVEMIHTIDVSPDGKLLAFVDENREKLHVIDIATGNEVASAKLGKKFENNYTDKNGEIRSGGCPFAFQSNTEILLSGMATAMLFDIETGKSKNISFPKPYNEYLKTCVTSFGNVSGRTIETKNHVTFEISQGKIIHTIPSMSFSIFNDNEYSKNVVNKLEYVNRRTKENIPDSYHWSDNRHTYKFKGVKYHDSYTPGLTTVQKDSRSATTLYLAFLMGGGWHASWLTGSFGNGYFYIWQGKRIQIFNHSLTSNEIEKQQLLSIIESGNSEYFEAFMSSHPSSKYGKKHISDLWQKASNPSDYTLRHYNNVKKFIDTYGSYLGLEEAKKEMENILKVRFDQLSDNDIPAVDRYIEEFPQSPYIEQTKKKQLLAHKPYYDAVCLEQSSQPYLDYIEKYPHSPYLDDVRERAKVIQQREEEERIAEQKRLEEERLAEQKRQEEERLAEQKRQEEARLAEQKRQEEAHKKQLATNSNISNWKLGNKICNCQENSHIMVILDSWNEDKTSFKGQILASDVPTFEGQTIKKDNVVWFEPKGWHKCLDDEVEYCLSHNQSESSNGGATVEKSEPSNSTSAKDNLAGKTVYWDETVSFNIGGNQGLLGSLLSNALGTNRVSYNVRYTAIVEATIGENSVKCVISNAQIIDPSWASANYIKYKSQAMSSISSSIGQTRVKQLNEVKTK